MLDEDQKEKSIPQEPTELGYYREWKLDVQILEELPSADILLTNTVQELLGIQHQYHFIIDGKLFDG